MCVTQMCGVPALGVKAAPVLEPAHNMLMEAQQAELMSLLLERA